MLSRCIVCGTLAKYVSATGPAFPYCSRRCQILDGAEAHRRAQQHANIRHVTPRPKGFRWPTTPRRTARVAPPQSSPPPLRRDDVGSDCAVGVLLTEDLRACMNPALRWGRAREVPLATDAILYGTKGRIGKGAYGFVVRMSTPSGARIAIKYSPIHDGETIGDGALGDLELRNLDHPNVTGICDAGIARDPAQEASAPPKWFGIVMDAAVSDLGQFLRTRHIELRALGKEGALAPVEMAFLGYQVVRGIAYCQSRLVLNFDVKGSNFLVSGARVAGEPELVPRVAVTDLGLARAMCTCPVNVDVQYTLWYRPPETLMGMGHIGTYKGDVWATGCLLYEMATGQALFEAKTQLDLMRLIIEALGTPSVVMRNKWLPDWGSSFSRIYSAAAVSGFFESIMAPDIAAMYPGLDSLLRRMLVMDPDQRCTIFEALDDPYFADARRRVERLFPSVTPIMSLKFADDGCVAAEHAVAVMLSMQSESWKPMAVGDPPHDYARIYSDLIGVWLATNPTTDSPTLFASIATARSLCIAGYAPVHGEWDYVVWACTRIAMRVRTCCETQFPDDYVDSVTNSRAFHRVEFACMVALDFDFSQPTAFDFYVQYAKLNPAVGPSAWIAGRLVLLTACASDEMAGRMPPSDLAANALGYIQRHQGGILLPTERPFVTRPAVCAQLDRLVRAATSVPTPLLDCYAKFIKGDPAIRDVLANVAGNNFLM